MTHCNFLTHWVRDKMADISKTTFSNAFSWMKPHELLLRFHWILFLSLILTIFKYWFWKWRGPRLGDKLFIGSDNGLVPIRAWHRTDHKALSEHDDVIKWKHFPRNWPFVRGPGPGEFPTQRPVTRSFDVFFDQRLNKRLSKQPWGW